MTPFVRFVVVLSMVRHAFGMPETPPNQVLVSLALLLTMFVMAPVVSANAPAPEAESEAESEPAVTDEAAAVPDGGASEGEAT